MLRHKSVSHKGPKREARRKNQHPFWKRLLLGHPRNIIDMRDINGHSQLHLGIVSHPFAKSELTSIDIVFYTLWAAKHSKTTEAIIFNLPQISNYKGVYNIDDSRAEDCARRLGDQKKEVVEVIARAFHINAPVRTFESIKNDERFQNVYSQLKELSKEDPYIYGTLSSLVPNSIKLRIKEWQLIRLFGWEAIKNVPGGIRERYIESHNRLKDFLEPHLIEFLKTKPKEERRRLMASIKRDYEERIKQVSDYALQEVALILMMNGVKIGHGNERGNDDLAIYISQKYGIGNVNSDSFRYLLPSEVVEHDFVLGPEPMEPYRVKDYWKKILITDTEREITKKLGLPSHQNKAYNSFMERILRELGISIREDITRIGLGKLIFDNIIKPIQKEMEKARKIRINWKRIYRCAELNAIKNLHDFKNNSILVIGCGSGLEAASIAKTASNVIAITSSDEDYRLACRLPNHLPESERDKIAFMQMDGNALRFKNNSFDVVLLRQLLGNAGVQENTLKEANRVLKDNGRMILFEPVLHDHQRISSPVKEEQLVITKPQKKINPFDFLVKKRIMRIVHTSHVGYRFRSEEEFLQYMSNGGRNLFGVPSTGHPQEKVKLTGLIRALPNKNGFILAQDVLKVTIARKLPKTAMPWTRWFAWKK